MYHYVNERIGRSPRHSLKDAKETRHKNVQRDKAQKCTARQLFATIVILFIFASIYSFCDRIMFFRRQM